MDPIANLAEQRNLAEYIMELADLDPDGETQSRIAEAGERLAELVQALDEWMTKGGLSPWPAKDVAK